MVIILQCLFLTLPWVNLRSEIVAIPGHTHLFFDRFSINLCIKGVVWDCKLCQITGITLNDV